MKALLAKQKYQSIEKEVTQSWQTLKCLKKQELSNLPDSIACYFHITPFSAKPNSQVIGMDSWYSNRTCVL